MNTHMTRRILGALFAVTMFATAHDAHAGLFRTYLSVNGNDANPCTVPAPCRLLPAALAAVNDGGEIWMLDSGNFNTSMVDVTKSVTILAIPGALGSIVASGGLHAINMSTAAGVKVTLRNLNMLNLGGLGNFGVYMSQGAELTVEDCEIHGMNSGIVVTAPNSVLAVKDTMIRNTTGVGVRIAGTVKATLDGVHLLNGFTGLQVSNNASAVVNNSVFANNSNIGVTVAADVGTASGSTASLVLANSVVHANGTGIAGLTSGASDVASITLQSNVLTGNRTGVNAPNTIGSANVTVVLDGNALIGNTAAITYGSPAVVFSRGNNTLKNNATDVTGPALTTLAGQ